MVPNSPSLYKTVSSSSRHTLQTTPQSSNPHTVILPLEGQVRSAGLDESEKAGLCNRSRATIRDPPSEQHGGRSSGHLSQRASRPSTAASKPLPSMPIDSQSFDLRELQRGQVHTQVNGNLGGAGKSRTNLQSTLGDRNASRGDVSSVKGSREPSVSDIGGGRSLPRVRPNDLEASCMFLVLIFVHLILTQLASWFPT